MASNCISRSSADSCNLTVWNGYGRSISTHVVTDAVRLTTNPDAIRLITNPDGILIAANYAVASSATTAIL